MTARILRVTNRKLVTTIQSLGTMCIRYVQIVYRGAKIISLKWKTKAHAQFLKFFYINYFFTKLYYSKLFIYFIFLISNNVVLYKTKTLLLFLTGIKII